jgi:hypothetical protein
VTGMAAEAMVAEVSRGTNDENTLTGLYHVGL